MPALREVLRRRAFRRGLTLRRAWQNVLDGNDPDVVTRLVDRASLAPLAVAPFLAALLGIPATVRKDVPRCLAQYLVATELYASLLPQTLLAVTGHRPAMAAPKAWRHVLEASGAPTNEIGSRIALAAFALKSMARGLKTAATLLGQTDRQPQPDFERSHVFCDVAPAILPKRNQAAAENMLLWYRANIAAQDRAELLVVTKGRSDVVTTVSQPLPPLTGLSQRIAFAIRVFRLAAVTSAALVVGRWWPACLLRDLVQLEYARKLGTAHLPVAYAYDNSSWIHRPLFTIWAERAKATPSRLLFYSTNIDEALRLEPNANSPAIFPGYRLMNWSEVLVWDQYQAESVVNFGIPPARARVVGIVPFTDNGQSLPALPPGSVAVFDVAPHKPARLSVVGAIPAYYKGAVISDFLEDIHAALSAHGLTMVLKQKRDIGTRADPSYAACLANLAKHQNVIIVDPGISAPRLIEATDACISTPFSSPSLIGEAHGKPAAFYDPTGRLIATERQRHGLPLLKGREELERWLRSR